MKINKGSSFSGTDPIKDKNKDKKKSEKSNENQGKSLEQDKVQISKPENKAFSKSELGKKKIKLTGYDVDINYLNDIDLINRDNDDLGMTTSYNIKTTFNFEGKDNSKTEISLRNSSALHTQFLKDQGDSVDQSTVTATDFEVGVNNNKWLIKNPNIKLGGKLALKTVDTNPNSMWARAQRALHKEFDFLEYNNQENPFIDDQSYLTPMVTIGYEKEKISENSLYLKTEAEVGIGTMISLQKDGDFTKPIRHDAYGAITFGYSSKEKPIIYLKGDANISNDPLTYSRDSGTVGHVGLGIGTEFYAIRNDRFNATIGIETKVLKPFGNYPNNPLPDQTGKFQDIHEMVNVSFKVNF